MTNQQFALQLFRARPETQNLLYAIVTGQWPNRKAVVGFCIDSRGHFDALSVAVLESKVSPESLDNALFDGEKLTALVGQRIEFTS